MTVARPTEDPNELAAGICNDAAEENLSASALRAQPCLLSGISYVNFWKNSSFNSLSFKLSILMPVYNEERTINRAIDEVLKADYPCVIELIVVDDGSTDSTWTLISEINDERIVVHRHAANKGKGAALLSAASLASGSYIVPFDADLEYVAADIPRILAPVLRGRCIVVYGTRLFGFNSVYQSYHYAIGNRILTCLTNILFDSRISDLHTCLKLMPLEMLKELALSERGFGLDTEITALLLKSGIRPFEVPVSYYSRSHAQGKKISWRDAIACVPNPSSRPGVESASRLEKPSAPRQSIL